MGRILGTASINGYLRNISLSLEEMARHIYAAGQTGVGKTGLLFNIAIDLIESGEGLTFIDYHGDTVKRLANSIPKNRISDTIYFDPRADPVIHFNVVREIGFVDRNKTATEIAVSIKHIYPHLWGDGRMQYFFVAAVHLLLECRHLSDNTHASLLHIHTIFTDDAFRRKLVERCDNQAVKNVWKRYDKYEKKLQQDIAAAIENKAGQFNLDPYLERIMTGASTIDIPTIMDNKKILLVDLSAIGEIPAKLIGTSLVTVIGQTAFSRVDTPEEERVPHHLIMDECQNAGVGIIPRLLSEARKFKLRLTLAHQFLDQIPELFPAIFGTVGTFIVFRCSPLDGELFAKVTGAQPNLLTNQANFEAYMRVTDGDSPTFQRVRMVPPNHDGCGSFAAVRKNTTANYTR